MLRRWWMLGGLSCGLGLIALVALSGADDPPAKSAGNTPPAATVKVDARKDEAGKTAGKLVPLNKQETVLLDAERKRLVLKSKVVLRQGALELLCCLKSTKEHEAILAVEAKAYVVHTGLLALGAQPGKPVEFDPEFKPPTGQRIQVFVQWADEMGKFHRAPAQSWIRNSIHRYYAETLDKLPAGVNVTDDSGLRYDPKAKELIWYGPMDKTQRDNFKAQSKDKAYQKAIDAFFDRSQAREMKAEWVFAGSGFFEDDNQQRYYRAEDGDLICVANFGSALMDVTSESTAGNEELLFEAYTERIPPVGTDVTIELIPVPNPEAPAKPRTTAK